MRRLVLAVVLVLLAAVAVACGSEPSPAQRLAEALTSKNAAAAADATSDPTAATKAFTGTFDGMGDAKLQVSVTGDEDSGLSWTWKLPHDRTVEYDTSITEADGAVRWSPTLIHPKLTAGGRLLYSDDKTYDVPVVDRKGKPVMTWQEVTVVTLDPAHADSAREVAAKLTPVTQSITAASIRADLQDAKTPVTVVSLRAADAKKVGRLDGIAGVTTRTEGRLLTATKDLNSPVVSGLEEKWRASIDDAAGATVLLVDAAGKPTGQVQTFDGRTPTTVETTLDVSLMRAADAAVAKEKRPTMLVAIRPSTGGILAVAQNSAADKQGPIALTGLYPPGSTFKTITTAAALREGIAKPDSMLPCPGKQRFGDRVIPNDDEFDLGTVPLHTAFARSCNTTMAALSTRLDDTALTDTARMFGLGVDYTIPGVTTITGSVPAAKSETQKVENGIGQGTVTASPFGMAMVEASLAARRTVTPTLIQGQSTGENATPQDIPADVVDALRSMMRETVTAGTATALRDVRGLGGKTGTAEFGDGKHAHGWFTGVVGDLAFATLVVGGDSSSPAVQVSGDFVRAVDGITP
ncbi:penicillin-binding transpeptidase domain-containing protein [Gordonia hydrophobica]|uniref:Penicillin-binding transpeptidase domain-containing protein n=1 Tax=Gordonia hydrophobica TaxID=40516 RepID=A0ABZ2TX34_9ACTN|nr:penicillin-binding transpeptidase domain-containing protein [Gordonia hydrophobica]MBM7366259.1 cell division protein FtsI/penicillin-binding protein 2 [Gordonia hydrophobica]